jgi:cell division protein ZapD
MPSYDYPFNERIRTLLRVEDLFAKLLHNIEAGHEHHHHCALITLLQILDVVDRSELKLDLLQELERQKVAMSALVGNPAIAANTLNKILSEIDQAAEGLRAETTKLGQSLRANEWLMGIKQRAGIPGGVCEFDVPSYHYWLGLGETRRAADFTAWLKPFTHARGHRHHLAHTAWQWREQQTGRQQRRLSTNAGRGQTSADVARGIGR